MAVKPPDQKTEQVTVQEKQTLEPPKVSPDYQTALDNKAKMQTIRDKQKSQIEERKRIEESKPRIMILGSRHLASHIVYALREVAKMIVVSNDDPNYIWQNPMVKKEVRPSEVSLFQFALYDLESNLKGLIDIQKPDFIINTISIHDALFSEGNPVGTYMTNSLYTLTMMKAILQANSNAQLIHISTDKIYGDQGVPEGLNRIQQREEDMVNPGKFREVEVDGYWADFKINEDNIPNPLGNKAISRYVQETIILQMCKTYNIQYMILRVGNMFGRYTAKQNVINSMIDSAEATNTVNIFGDRYASRDFVDIEAVARLIKKVLIENYDRAQWNEIYNIGGNHPTRMYLHGLSYFIQVMYSGAGVKNLDPDSYAFLKPFGTVKTKQNPPRCFEDGTDAKIRIWLDCKKAVEKLGWTLDDWFEPWEKVLKNNILFNQVYHHGKTMDELNDYRSKLEVDKNSERLLAEMDAKLRASS